MKLDLKNTFFLLDMFLIVGGEGSSNKNVSRDESVEAGDKSVEARDESIEAGEKTPQSCYNLTPVEWNTDHHSTVVLLLITHIQLWTWNNTQSISYMCKIGR